MLRTSSGLWLVRQSRDASTAMVIEVLVPVGHRALALGEAAQAGGEPLVGVVHGLTAETQARHIGPIGHDSDHFLFLP